jgi:hypothetical protein
MAVSTYPSYERAIAKYRPRKDPGEKADAVKCDGNGDGCDCPRIWQYDRWVYHCDGRYLFWHHGYWYYYGNPYFHYFSGPYHGQSSKGRRVRQE